MNANGRATLAALGALAIMAAGITAATAQEPVRVRGTIDRVDGSTY